MVFVCSSFVRARLTLNLIPNAVAVTSDTATSFCCQRLDETRDNRQMVPGASPSNRRSRFLTQIMSFEIRRVCVAGVVDSACIATRRTGVKTKCHETNVSSACACECGATPVDSACRLRMWIFFNEKKSIIFADDSRALGAH